MRRKRELEKNVGEVGCHFFFWFVPPNPHRDERPLKKLKHGGVLGIFFGRQGIAVFFFQIRMSLKEALFCFIVTIVPLFLGFFFSVLHRSPYLPWTECETIRGKQPGIAYCKHNAALNKLHTHETPMSKKKSSCNSYMSPDTQLLPGKTM